MQWVQSRRAERSISHYSQASEYLQFPLEMPVPEFESVQQVWPNEFEGVWDYEPVDCKVVGRWFYRREVLRDGRPFVEWQRPPKSKVDPNRRLLTTGQYADEFSISTINASKTNETAVGEQGIIGNEKNNTARKKQGTDTDGSETPKNHHEEPTVLAAVDHCSKRKRDSIQDAHSQSKRSFVVDGIAALDDETKQQQQLAGTHGFPARNNGALGDGCESAAK